MADVIRDILMFQSENEKEIVDSKFSVSGFRKTDATR